MKHLRPHRATIVGRQLRDASALLLHRCQPRFAQDDHAGFVRHLVEHTLRDMRLDRIRPAGRRTAFALERLVPVQGLAVAGDQPREVLAGDPADAARIADVHRAQSAGSHAAEMPSRFDQAPRAFPSAPPARPRRRRLTCRRKRRRPPRFHHAPSPRSREPPSAGRCDSDSCRRCCRVRRSTESCRRAAPPDRCSR